MAIVNIHAAKTHLSRLVDRAAAGEEVVIARSGTPVARLVALAPAPVPVPKRALGALAGTLRISADFDAPLPAEIASDFEGGPCSS